MSMQSRQSSQDLWEQKKQELAKAWLHTLESDTVEAYEQFLARHAGSYFAEEARHRKAWLFRSALYRDMTNAALRKRYFEVRTPELRLLDASLLGKPHFFKDRLLPFLWRALLFVAALLLGFLVHEVLTWFVAGLPWFTSDFDAASRFAHVLGGLFAAAALVYLLVQEKKGARKGEERIYGFWEHGRWLLGSSGRCRARTWTKSRTPFAPNTSREHEASLTAVTLRITRTLATLQAHIILGTLEDGLPVSG